MTSLCPKFLLMVLVAGGVHALDGLPKASFKPNPKLERLADFSALDLGRFEWEKPEGEPHSGRVTDYSGMTYDPHHNRILLFGGGHSATWTDAIYAFDLSTLKWSALYKPTPHKFYKKENMDRAFWKAGPEGKYPRPVGRHTYDLLVVPSDRPEFLMLRTGTGPSSAARGFDYTGGAGGVYDFKTGQWSIIDAKNVGKFGGYGGVAEYDPLSKKVIGIMRQQVYAFDPATRTTKKILAWIHDKHKAHSGYSGSLVYYPPDKNMYIFSAKSREVWSLALNRKVLSSSTLRKAGVLPVEQKGYPVFQYDSKNQVLGGATGNTFHVFDPVKKTWAVEAIKGGAPGGVLSWCLCYCPVDNVFIFISKKHHTWAYRWKR